MSLQERLSIDTLLDEAIELGYKARGTHSEEFDLPKPRKISRAGAIESPLTQVAGTAFAGLHKQAVKEHKDLGCQAIDIAWEECGLLDVG